MVEERPPVLEAGFEHVGERSHDVRGLVADPNPQLPGEQDDGEGAERIQHVEHRLARRLQPVSGRGAGLRVRRRYSAQATVRRRNSSS